MKRLSLLLFLAALLPAAALGGTTAIIQGTVLDAHTGKPVSDVQVTAVSASGNVSARTDGKGFYMLWDVPPGPAIVAFQREGFMLEERLLCVYPGATRNVSLHMHEHTGPAYVVMGSLMREPVLDETDGNDYLGPC